MTTSSVWDSFEKSSFGKKVIASAASAPGNLADVSWQKGNGNIPDVTKTHDIKEVQKAIQDVADKAPTGRVGSTLVKLVRIAEAWEAKGDPKLQPFIAELDEIINTAIAGEQAEVVTAVQK